MNKVLIVADSTCDLTPEYVKEHDVRIIPLRVSFPGENIEYLDGVDITSLDIYKKVEELGVIPKTSALNAHGFIEYMEPLIEEGYDIVFTGIGSGLSSSHNTVSLAMQELPEGRVFVVDSMNLSTGIGLLVNKMVEYRDAGMSAKEIAEKVQPLAYNASAKFTIDRMDYLYKGGRCSGLAKFVLNTFKVHPICKVINGKLTVAKVALGAYRKGINEQIKELKKDLEADNVDTSCVFITDSQCMDGEDDYAYEEVAKLIDPSCIHRTHAGCIISSHCGPKTIGVLYLLKEKPAK